LYNKFVKKNETPDFNLKQYVKLRAVLLCKARGTEEEGGGPEKKAARSSEKASTFGL